MLGRHLMRPYLVLYFHSVAKCALTNRKILNRPAHKFFKAITSETSRPKNVNNGPERTECAVIISV